MTKMAAMPIYGKNLKNPLLHNQKANGLETWYAALGTQVWYFVELDFICGKVKFGSICFCVRNAKIVHFSETFSENTED